MYQDEKIAAAGLTRADCIEEERPGWQVAAATVEVIKGFARSNVPDPNPFIVIDDPFPNGNPPPHSRDVAHANIVHPIPLRGSDKWYRDLALVFKTLT